MTLKTKNLGLLAAGALLFAVPAAAQISVPAETALVDFGKVSLYPTVQLLDAGIDDNVFNDGVTPS